jgi:hypothetical protein
MNGLKSLDQFWRDKAESKLTRERMITGTYPEILCGKIVYANAEGEHNPFVGVVEPLAMWRSEGVKRI